MQFKISALIAQLVLMACSVQAHPALSANITIDRMEMAESGRKIEGVTCGSMLLISKDHDYQSTNVQQLLVSSKYTLQTKSGPPIQQPSHLSTRRKRVRISS